MPRRYKKMHGNNKSSTRRPGTASVQSMSNLQTPPANGDRRNVTNSTPGNANNGSQRASKKTTSPSETDTKPPAKGRGSQISKNPNRTPSLELIKQPPIEAAPRAERRKDGRSSSRKRNQVNSYPNDHLVLNPYRVERNTASTAGNEDNIDDRSNDGDDEDEGDDASSALPETDSPATPSPNNSMIITTTEQSPSTPPRPTTRSQAKLPTTSLPSPDPSTTPSPKRNRDAAFSAPPSSTVALGDRCFKRQRNSVSESLPLPEPLELKRTRNEQKKFEEKLGKDHVFDPLHAGSARREVVDAKSGAGEWKRETLHQEPWDGSKEQ